MYYFIDIKRSYFKNLKYNLYYSDYIYIKHAQRNDGRVIMIKLVNVCWKNGFF